MAELADARDLKSRSRNRVGVRFPLSADIIMSMNKILTYQEAHDKINFLKTQGATVTLAVGCFDILHMGHIEYLKKGKEHSSFLFVGIENDKSIKLNKGRGRPINKLIDRLSILAEIEFVDYVSLLTMLSITKMILLSLLMLNAFFF